ncbi:MAG: hypothetical protein ACR2PT_24045 [Endozoicomonas sp.]
MSNDKKTKKDLLLDKDQIRDELPEKGSKRALRIRRALEDREDSKKLSMICGDDYWSDI